MNPVYAKARFITSVPDPALLPTDTGREVAFVGRSNAGKSSTINALCSQKNLARTSKTPGRTQQINVFELGEGRHLVDLPGYGYAKAPEAERRRWGRFIEAYLTTRRSLQGLVIVMDIRHPLRDHDCQMLDWCQARGLDAHILLNKADKLKRGAQSNTLLAVRRAIKEAGWPATAQTFSAHKREGIDQAHARLDGWLGYDVEEAAASN